MGFEIIKIETQKRHKVATIRAHRRGGIYYNSHANSLLEFKEKGKQYIFCAKKSGGRLFVSRAFTEFNQNAITVRTKKPDGIYYRSQNAFFASIIFDLAKADKKDRKSVLLFIDENEFEVESGLVFYRLRLEDWVKKID